jgi:hypothetical protein
MKIALVLDHFDGRKGGLEAYSCDLAQWLAARGHEVHVTAFGFGQPLPDGLRCHQLEVSRSPCTRAATAERFLRSLAPDIVHDMGIGWYFDVLQPHFGTRSTSRRRSLAAESLPQRVRTILSLAKGKRWRSSDANTRRPEGSSSPSPKWCGPISSATASIRLDSM